MSCSRYRGHYRGRATVVEGRVGARTLPKQGEHRDYTGVSDKTRDCGSRGRVLDAYCLTLALEGVDHCLPLAFRPPPALLHSRFLNGRYGFSGGRGAS